jgi:hypothetical protein
VPVAEAAVNLLITGNFGLVTRAQIKPAYAGSSIRRSHIADAGAAWNYVANRHKVAAPTESDPLGSPQPNQFHLVLKSRA